MENGPGHIQRTKWAFPVGNDPYKKRKLLWRLLRLGVGEQLQPGNKKKGGKLQSSLCWKRVRKRENGFPFETSQLSRAVGSPN